MTGRQCVWVAVVLLVLGAHRVQAATYYVRTDGGTSSQCTGLVDAAYPGSGTGQPCGWSHPFWALDGVGAWRIQGGDTIVVDAGSYMMGYGAPNTGWCDSAFPWDCHLPPLPSGTVSAPTRIVGQSWTSGCAGKPELWGTERSYHIIDLDGTNNAVIACLELTDHLGCVEFHANPAVACNRSSFPYGDWAASGIVGSASTGVTLRDLDIHGFADNGLWAGGLSNWVLDGVRLAGNGWSGWNGDVGAGSSNSGTMTLSRVTIEWNGCVETYPGKQPDHCWAQQSGGYGDGLGTASTGGDWTVTDSLFQYNTSDGLDLLYLGVSGQGGTARVERTLSRGNAGNQIKVAATATIVNCVIVGNCAYFESKPFAQEMQSGDLCRALGNSLALSPHMGDQVAVVNSTIVGQGDCLMEAECDTANCNGSESLLVDNNVLRGYTDWRQPFENTCYMFYDAAIGAVETNDWNVVYDVKDGNGDCAAGANNLCTSDPLFVNATLDAFDGHLKTGSPAIDSGLPVGSLGGLVPPVDYEGNGRPAGAGVDRGAYEYGAAPARFDYIVGEGYGPGVLSEVKVYTAAGVFTGVDFFAYGAMQYGVNVAAGDIDGDGLDEILTGPGPGTVYGPQVRAWQEDGAAIAKVNFYAYGTLKYGVKVGSGETDSDGYDEILTGPAQGVVFGPHVRGFNYDNVGITAIAKISFFAYSTLRYGVNVTSGDVDKDGYDEILTGPGPGAIFGPQVRAFNVDGGTTTSIAKINFMAYSVLGYGVNLAGGDVDADGFDEIATGPGPGPPPNYPPRVLGFNYDGTSITPLPGYDVTSFSTTGGGARVALADIQPDGRDELIVGEGAYPALSGCLMVYHYDGSSLTLVGSLCGFGPYGVNVAMGNLGY